MFRGGYYANAKQEFQWNGFFLLLNKSILMKTIRQAAVVLMIAASFTASGCGPKGDKDSTDQATGKGEGAIDSSRMAPIDTTHSTTADTARHQ